ncbi:hypothetical protein GCM10011492_16160 [Flexivirga endophytica]|uniref:Uncharacterized protein n=2 Tax=Flexivirga endophytica TaxID=1849103 RepID=A0A916T209_9MICO|nr:hypothetical protein GCM10011492_16160 [Flexivirga endophytica]GHB55152.1 hypothetical protein GCM10008112_25470 [Flexivirga endophytica]
MVWEVASRRGRIARGPVASGRWHTFEDMNAVTGWLLWSHRMASEYGGMTGREFAAAARERGIPLSETEVSRTENGENDVAVSAIGKYERMLWMPPGTLSAPLRSAAREAPHARGAEKLATLRSVPKSLSARQDVVDDFYRRYLDDEQFTGSDWLTLIDAITYGEPSLLPDALAAQWIRTLLDECMRAVNPAYFPRFEALSTVAEHDHYATHLLAATRDLTSVQGASGAMEAWSVVGDIRAPEVIDLLLAELPSVPAERFFFHAAALNTPIHRGRLSHAQQQIVADHLADRLSTWSLKSYEPIAALAAELPEALGEPILRRIDTDVHPLSRLTGRRARHDVSAEVSAYTHAAMSRTWPDHPTGSVLPELLRLIVNSERFGIRHHAATLIYCSPFAAAICAEAAEICTTGRDPITRQLATYLMSRLATPDNDEALRLLLKNKASTSLVINTLTAMAHAGVLTEWDDLKPFLQDAACRYTGIYAAGITHHPDLYSDEATGDQATWWREKRGGVWV